MREFAIVKEIKRNQATNEEEIYVLPMIIAACQTCKSGCTKQGKPFKVLNTHNLKIKIGSTVRIGFSNQYYSLNGLFAFFVPIICSILGFILTPHISEKIFGSQYVELYIEEFRAIGVVSFLIISTSIMYFINRSSLHLKKPEITQVV